MGLSEPSQRVFPFQMEEEDTDPGDKVYHAGTRSTSTLSKSFFTSSHDISQRQKQFCPNNSCSPCACFNFTWGATCKLCVKNASGNCFLFFSSLLRNNVVTNFLLGCNRSQKSNLHQGLSLFV